MATDTVSNPDQRITEDVRNLTTTTLTFVLLIVNGSFTILAFSGVLWTISPLLFGVAVAYAAVGSLLTLVLGRPLIWLNYNQSDKEAVFRADLIHVRENAESLALSHREPLVKARLLRHLDELAANFKQIVAVSRNLGFFTTGYNYLIQIIPALIVAPLYIRGDGRVRRDHAVGDGIRPAARGVLTPHHPVPIDFLVCGRARAGGLADRGDRPGPVGGGDDRGAAGGRAHGIRGLDPARRR